MTHTGEVFRVRVVPPGATRKRFRLRISKIGAGRLADETIEAADAAHADRLALERLEQLEAEAGQVVSRAGGLTVRALGEAYVSAQERSGSWGKLTRATVEDDLARVAAVFGDLDVADLPQLQADLWDRLLERYARSTVLTTRSSLRAAWVWGLERGLVGAPLPRVRVPGRAGRRSGKRAWEVGESRAALEAIARERPRFWLPCALLAATGVRPGALLKLERRDVGEGVVYLRHTKGDRPRRVAAPTELLERLPPSGPLFLSRRGKSLTPYTLRNMVRPLFDSVAPDPSEVGLYSWRKSWASIAANSGVHPLVAKAQLGNPGSDAHERVYVRVSDEALRAAVAVVWSELTQPAPPKTPEIANARFVCASTTGDPSEREAHKASGTSGLLIGLPQKSGADEGAGRQLERVLDPQLARIADWADADPSAMRRLLEDDVLRARLLEALEERGGAGAAAC